MATGLKEKKPSKAIINLSDVKMSFGSVQALKGVSAEIVEGEFFSLLGPSGCGKTTLLRLIAGFSEPTSGSIFIDGKPMAGISANQRPTNMVFQNYAIFPHLNVGDNVGYGLKRKKLSRLDLEKEIEDALEMVDMAGYSNRGADTLSGGQQQRVALARALVMRPKVVLLDEPLSALDKKLRDQMQVELRQLQKSIGITFILVTHDQEEALIMSDRIAVMFDGEIDQLATPQDLYRRPLSRKVASFIGVMNFLDAKYLSENKEIITLDVQSLGRLEVSKSQCPYGLVPNEIQQVGVRPEMMTILLDELTLTDFEVVGVIVNSEYYGDMTYYSVLLPNNDKPVTISMRNTAGRPVLRAGDKTRVSFSPDSIVLFK
jgi:spermidine/putrescine transport system ATP-binding protein